MGRMIAHKYRTTIVHVDSYTNNVLSGYVHNPYLTDGDVPFVSTIEFLQLIEQMLDEMQFPQAFEQIRTFDDAHTAHPIQAGAEPRPGKLATFTIKIFFRQNASWQGTVSWNNRQQEEDFRSVLELLTLMDSALQSAVC